MNNDNWVFAEDDKINQVNRDMVLSYGIPILLFYNYVG